MTQPLPPVTPAPPGTPSPPVTQALPPTPPPGARTASPTPGGAAPKRGWPASAKVAAIVLALTTLGAAGTGVVLSSSAKSDTDDVKDDLAGVQDDLEDTKDELAAVKDDLKAATSKADGLQGELDGTKDDLKSVILERDEARAAAKALRTLFPLDFAAFAEVPIGGSYSLTVVTSSAECSGYANDEAACSDNSFPTTLEIAGDAGAGYTVASSFFTTTDLTKEAGSYTASGNVLDSAADLCNGQPSRTTFSIRISVGGVTLDADDRLGPTLLFLDFDMGTAASDACTATSRTVDLDGAPA